MPDVEHVTHDAWCCDEHERAHVRVEQDGGDLFFRLALDEWRGDEDAVLAAVDEWLTAPPV